MSFWSFPSVDVDGNRKYNELTLLLYGMGGMYWMGGVG